MGLEICLFTTFSVWEWWCERFALYIFMGNFAGNLAFWQESGFVISFFANPTLNTWNHIAVSRISGIVRLFMNGILTNTNSNATNLGIDQLAYIGNDGVFNKNTDGYLDEFRITNGVGRYSSSFTVPSAPYPDN